MDWILGRLGEQPWSLIACCGTESRSVAVARHLGRERLKDAVVLQIQDPEPLDQSLMLDRLARRANEYGQYGFASNEIHAVKLLSDLSVIKSVVTNLVDAGSTRLLVDITSLPKMWFFPIIQAALDDDRIEDVVVTYTAALGYAEQLSENVSPLRVIPGFFAEDGRSQHDSIIVGIGFEPLGIVQLLSDQVSKRIRLIFPFPPGPPGHRRNWMFVKQIEDLTLNERIDPPDRVHIHMYDCPQVFEALVDMTEAGNKTAAIAPYGPKTVSLAMCLFSLAAASAGRPRVPIYYAQPLRYALDYTNGVQMRGSAPESTAYCFAPGGQKSISVVKMQEFRSRALRLSVMYAK